MGTAMIKMVIRENVDSLETLILKAIMAGVNSLLCHVHGYQGIREEELIEGVESARRAVPSWRRRGKQRQPLHLSEIVQ